MTVTTRDRILENLRQLQTATVSELSRHLHTTPANIRYHQESLLADGLIEPLPPNPENSGRGRPAKQFRLSPKTKPDDFAQLGNDLLSTLLLTSLPEDPIERLRLVAIERIKGLHLEGSATQQMTQAVEFLNHHAYQAHWEARRMGPEIRLSNCPYYSILADHPEMCEIDRLMLEAMLVAQATILESVRSDGQSSRGCLIALKFQTPVTHAPTKKA